MTTINIWIKFSVTDVVNDIPPRRRAVLKILGTIETWKTNVQNVQKIVEKNSQRVHFSIIAGKEPTNF